MILQLERHNPLSLAVKDSKGGELTYKNLTEFSITLKKLIPERSLLFIMTKNDIGGVAWTIGTIDSGNVPLILNARLDKDLYLNLFKTYQPAYVCLPIENKNEQYVTIAEFYGYALQRTDNEIYPLHKELSHLLPTSGSTGSPKLVRHKYTNIQAASENISSFFELKKTDRALLVLPLYYTMGLSVVFSHLYSGASVLITDLSMTDRKFWTFIKDEKATSFTGVPYSFEILNMMRFFRMDLPDLELLTQGGGKMNRELNIKFAQYCLDNNKRWIATYGQSECTARMAYLPKEYALSKCGSIGIAVPNAELSLRNEQGEIITQPNVEGELCYKGMNVTMGYAHSKDDLLKGDERNGFILTGDLAYKDDDGFYYITGRKGRFVKLFGLRIGLDECEQIIKTKFDVECACIGNDDKIFVYITNTNLISSAKEELIEKTKLMASVFEIRVISEIPKNEAGKILYTRLETVKN